MQSEALEPMTAIACGMADVIEIRVAALRRLPEQTHRRADPKPETVSGDAANDVALGHPAHPDDDGLRAARGFAASFALGFALWAAVGALVWLGLS
jgi:hypothetical protein